MWRRSERASRRRLADRTRLRRRRARGDTIDYSVPGCTQVTAFLYLRCAEPCAVSKSLLAPGTRPLTEGNGKIAVSHGAVLTSDYCDASSAWCRAGGTAGFEVCALSLAFDDPWPPTEPYDLVRALQDPAYVAEYDGRTHMDALSSVSHALRQMQLNKQIRFCRAWRHCHAPRTTEPRRGHPHSTVTLNRARCRVMTHTGATSSAPVMVFSAVSHRAGLFSASQTVRYARGNRSLSGASFQRRPDGTNRRVRRREAPRAMRVLWHGFHRDPRSCSFASAA